MRQEGPVNVYMRRADNGFHQLRKLRLRNELAAWEIRESMHKNSRLENAIGQTDFERIPGE